MKLQLFIIAAIIVFISCNDNNSDAVTAEPANTDTPSASVTAPVTPPAADAEPPDSLLIPWPMQDKPDPGQYCFINKLYTRNDTVFIDVDYIQFLMGEEAIAAARKKGDEEMVLDDYYIVNENSRIRTLPLAADVEYMSIYTKDKVYLKKSTPDELKTRISNDRIFILTLDNNLVVKTIKEQYLP